MTFNNFDICWSLPFSQMSKIYYNNMLSLLEKPGYQRKDWMLKWTITLIEWDWLVLSCVRLNTQQIDSELLEMPLSFFHLLNKVLIKVVFPWFLINDPSVVSSPQIKLISVYSKHFYTRKNLTKSSFLTEASGNCQLMNAAWHIWKSCFHGTIEKPLWWMQVGM